MNFMKISSQQSIAFTKSMAFSICVILMATGSFYSIGHATDWSQHEASTITETFIQTLEAVQRKARSPDKQPGIYEERNANAALVNLNQLIIHSKELKKMIDSGTGKNKTKGQYLQLEQFVSSIKFYIEKIEVGAAIHDDAKTAKSLYDQLTELYR